MTMQTPNERDDDDSRNPIGVVHRNSDVNDGNVCEHASSKSVVDCSLNANKIQYIILVQWMHMAEPWMPQGTVQKLYKKMQVSLRRHMAEAR